MKRLLVTRPRHSSGMEYLSTYTNKVIEFAREKGWDVQDVQGNAANPDEVQSRLNKFPIPFVFFNGHGGDNEICGHANRVLIDADSAHLLKDSIAYVRSCNALQGLGPSAVEHGCDAFIGYSSSFLIPMIDRYSATPLRDVYAKPVMDVSNTVALELLKNQSVDSAIRTSKKHAARHILKLIHSTEPHDRATLKAMVNNDTSVGYAGNGSAKLP